MEEEGGPKLLAYPLLSTWWFLYLWFLEFEKSHCRGSSSGIRWQKRFIILTQLESEKEILSAIDHLVAKKSLNTRVGDTKFLSPNFCLVQEVPHLDMIEG